jgi:hypothetical protein
LYDARKPVIKSVHLYYIPYIFTILYLNI